MRIFIAGLLFLGVSAHAAPLFALPPDAGSILRETEKPTPSFPGRHPEVQVEPTPSVSPLQVGPKVFVKVIRIVGASIFKEAELLKLLTGYTGKELTYGELEKAAAKVAAYYSERGYVVRVLFPPQDISSGLVLMYLIEGKLGSVKVDPSSKARLSNDTARRFITNAQPVGQSLVIRNLERGVLLLNDLPGIAATSSLESGEIPGSANLVLKLSDTPRLTGNVDLDNFGDRSTREYRLSGGLNINNPFGIGDQIGIKALTSIDNNYFRLSYSLPIGARGARLLTSFSYLHYELGGDFTALDASGDSLSMGASLLYPFIRSRDKNLYGAVAYDHRHFNDDQHGITYSDRDIHASNLSLNGDRLDSFYGGGVTTYGIILTIGSLNRSTGDFSDGAYSKVQMNMSRHQRLLDQTSLFISFNSQFAAKNLDSSEKFSLGGINGVRAYPTNEANGDHGILITTELRHNLTEKLQVSGFYDFGWTQLHESTWAGWNLAGNASNSYTLDGAGIALSYSAPGNFFVKGTVATRLSDNPGHNASGSDNDGTKREPRFWLQMSKFF